jgi:hypothetical protein
MGNIHLSNLLFTPTTLLSTQFNGSYNKELKELEEFKIKSYENPHSTFIIVKNFIDPTLCDCDQLENHFKKNPDDDIIFQTNNNNKNDNKRMQLQFTNDIKLENFKGFVEINNTVEKFIRNNLLTDKEESFNKSCSVLFSLEGCSKQVIHVDYDDSEEAIDHTKNCFIMLIALNDNTKLDAIKKNNIKKNNKSKPFRYSINLNSGDMFLARGIFIHGGSDYIEKNFRIHFYVNCKGYKPPQDATYLLANSELIKIQPYANYNNEKASLRNIKKYNKAYKEQKNKKLKN